MKRISFVILLLCGCRQDPVEIARQKCDGLEVPALSMCYQAAMQGAENENNRRSSAFGGMSNYILQNQARGQYQAQQQNLANKPVICNSTNNTVYGAVTTCQ